MRLLLWLVFVAVASAAYHLQALHSAGHGCNSPVYRGATLLDSNSTCNVSASAQCATISDSAVISQLCVSSLSAVGMSIRVNAYASGNTCTGTPSHVIFIGTGLCNDNSTSTCNSTHMTYAVYGNTGCTGQPSATHSYQLGTCVDPAVSSSQYPMAVSVSCT
jgi:hypothetical protein